MRICNILVDLSEVPIVKYEDCKFLRRWYPWDGSPWPFQVPATTEDPPLKQHMFERVDHVGSLELIPCDVILPFDYTSQHLHTLAHGSFRASIIQL